MFFRELMMGGGDTVDEFRSIARPTTAPRITDNIGLIGLMAALNRRADSSNNLMRRGAATGRRV
jgi:hypothetical protein